MNVDFSTTVRLAVVDKSTTLSDIGLYVEASELDNGPLLPWSEAMSVLDSNGINTPRVARHG